MKNPKLLFDGKGWKLVEVPLIDEFEYPCLDCKTMDCDASICYNKAVKLAIESAPYFDLNEDEVDIFDLKDDDGIQVNKLYDCGCLKFEIVDQWVNITSAPYPIKVARIVKDKPKEMNMVDEELPEMIAKIHDDIEGRYDLDSYDKVTIHSFLCDLQHRGNTGKSVELKNVARIVRDEPKEMLVSAPEPFNPVYSTTNKVEETQDELWNEIYDFLSEVKSRFRITRIEK